MFHTISRRAFRGGSRRSRPTSRPRARALGGRQRAPARRAPQNDERTFARSEPALARHVVDRDGIEVLAHEFLARVRFVRVGLGREADQEQAVLVRAERSQNIRIAFEHERRRVIGLLYFGRVRIGRAPIGDGGGRDRDRRAAGVRQRGGFHLASRRHALDLRAGRRRERCRPEHQIDARPARERFARQLDPHRAGRRVGEKAHRIDRLRWSGQRSISTRSPRKSSVRASTPSIAATIASSFARRPAPDSRSARNPLSAGTIVTPRASSVRRCSAVAGCSSIAVFIAGATMSGMRAAS